MELRGRKKISRDELIKETPLELTEEDYEWFIPAITSIMLDAFENKEYKAQINHQKQLKRRREKYHAEKSKEKDGHG